MRYDGIGALTEFGHHLLYDHILCDGQCFLYVRSLTDDHLSDATSDRVTWDFLPRERPPRLQCIAKNHDGGSTTIPSVVDDTNTFSDRHGTVSMLPARRRSDRGTFVGLVGLIQVL